MIFVFRSQEISHLTDLLVFIGNGPERIVPERRRRHGHDIAREFREIRRGCHRFAEFHVVLFRVVSSDAHYSDDEWQFRGFEVLADVANELSHPVTVFRESIAGILPGKNGVDIAVDHVVPTLEPDESG